MRATFLVCLVLAVMATVACGDAGTPDCPEGSDQFVKYELFMGRSNASGEVVDDDAWATFLGETVTPRFPDGLTVLDGRGAVAKLRRSDREGALKGARDPGIAGR